MGCVSLENGQPIRPGSLGYPGDSYSLNSHVDIADQERFGPGLFSSCVPLAISSFSRFSDSAAEPLLSLLPEAATGLGSFFRCRWTVPSDSCVAANMQCKESYPADFQDAFKRSPLKEWELDELRAKSSYPPVFVYGHLMLPTALKYIADIPQTNKVDMVYATLPGYKLHHFAESGKPGLPTIRPSSSPSDVVEGMLVFGLTREQRSDVQEIECVRTGHSMFMDVQVQVSLIDKVYGYEVKCQKSVDAGTFVWSWASEDTELQPMETSFWPIDDFLTGQLYANMVKQQSKVPVSDD